MGCFLAGLESNVLNTQLLKRKNAHEARKLYLFARLKEIEKRHRLLLRNQSLEVNPN